MTTPTKTRTILFAKIPQGKVDSSSFRQEEKPLPQLTDGSILCKVEYLSVDPYLRGRMSGVKTYTDPFKEGEPLESPAVCRVVKSMSSKWKEGDFVGTASAPWAEYAVLDGNRVRAQVPGVDPEAALSVVGMTALTAYFGMLHVGKLKEKDTVVITGAAGAVGYVAGCIAKIRGCRVVGIVGSEEKGKFLTGDLRFDNYINYKRGRIEEDLKRACPEGVDLFFDNVGGETGDAVRTLMKPFGRIVQCGSISQYQQEKPSMGPRQEMLIVGKRLKWKGFLVFDFHDKFDEAIRQLAQWYRDGKIPKRVTTFNGLAEAPRAFMGLFEGHNVGKTLVKV